jgi:shikimate kinase
LHLDNIFLLGFMGCGKTYWGKRLAERLGVPFLDLDAYLEAQEGRSIADIFSTDGEPAFRMLERDYLHQLPFAAGVVATGGGLPCFFDNMDWMNAHGHTIFLDTPVELLVRRLAPGRAHRPLLRDLSEAELPAFIEARLAVRLPFYNQAKRRVQQTENMTVDWLLD